MTHPSGISTVTLYVDTIPGMSAVPRGCHGRQSKDRKQGITQQGTGAAVAPSDPVWLLLVLLLESGFSSEDLVSADCLDLLPDRSLQLSSSPYTWYRVT